MPKFIDLTGQKFNQLTVLYKDIEKTKQTKKTYWVCQCDCGNTVIVYANALTKGFTKSCGCLKGSTGEKNIENILKENNIQFQKEYTVKEIGYLRYDFFLPELNRFIEYDGEQHYRENSGAWKTSSLKERAMKDKIKTEYAKNKNIDLVRIPYWERDNITLEMIIGNKYLK